MIRKAPRGAGGGGGGGGVGPSGAKEPLSKKASGLAQLVSALHQNAAAVVNSKTQLNGPDQVGLIDTQCIIPKWMKLIQKLSDKCPKIVFKINSHP